MAYDKLNWQNLQTTPLNSENLNHMDNGIYQNSQDIVTVGNKSTANMLKPNLQTMVANGVTCTNNGDGTYILSGTATNEAVFHILTKPTFSDTIKLCGCPSGGSSTTYFLRYANNIDNSFRDFGNGVNCTPFNQNDYPNTTVDIVIKGGWVISTPLIFKPMVTTNLSATYDDFVPFTGTSGQLNKDVADVRKDLDTTNANLLKGTIPISWTLPADHAYDNLTAECKNGIVNIFISFQAKLTAATDYLIGTIPTQYRPTKQKFTPMIMSSGSLGLRGYGFAIINTDGTIHMISGGSSAQTANDYHICDITYFI